MKNVETYSFRGLLLTAIILFCSTMQAEITTTHDGYNTTVVSTDTTGVVTVPEVTTTNKHVQSSKSLITIKFDVRRGTRLNFNWTLSCEEWYDFGSITLDGKTIVSKTSGEQSGAYDKMFTAPGTHTLVLTYEKDNMMDSGQDMMKITDFTLDHDAGSGPDGLRPFHSTTITEDGKFANDVVWYRLCIGTNKSYLYANSDGVRSTSTALQDSAYYWTFVRGEGETVRVYNMATGAANPLTITERVNKGAVTLGGEGETDFLYTENNDGFAFYMDGDTVSLYVTSTKMYCYKPTNISTIYRTSASTRLSVVYEGQPNLIPISGITLSSPSELELEEGQTSYVMWDLYPTNTVERDVEYVISNNKVVAADYFESSKGFMSLTAKGGGEATVTIRSKKRPEVKAEVKVKVIAKIRVTSITLDTDTLRMPVGEMHRIVVDVQPKDAYDPTYKWTNTKPMVATIGSDGTVYALSAGTTVLTCKANDDSGKSAKLVVVVSNPEEKTNVEHDQRYIFALHTDSALTAIPRSYIEDYSLDGHSLTLRMLGNTKHILHEVESVGDECPVELPRFQSYKFNNKFNDQLFSDVVAEESQLTADTLTLEVASIGKRLTASFQLADSLAKVWVGNDLQHSKETRLRFDKPITYTIGHENWHALQLVEQGKGYAVSEQPFGTECTVVVDWLTDRSTTDYQVPRIDITVGNGGSWTSNWIGQYGKSTYVDGTITIDGGGVFPSTPETPIQIKGRGNSSWSQSASSKNPYHFKFEEKQKPLGMKSGKHWLLISNKQTGSMTTNAIAHKAAALFGAAFPNHVIPVELWINGSYRGNYNLTERIALANNSVDLDDDSQAAIIELDTYTDEPIIRSQYYNLPTKLKDFGDADTDENSAHQAAANSFSTLTRAVSMGSNFDNLVDVDDLASFLLVNEFIGNCELKHPKSVFLYNENIYDSEQWSLEDPTPWHFGPLWDCDWAFGYQQSNSYFVSAANLDFFRDMGTSDDYMCRDYPRQFWYNLRYGSEAVSRAMYSKLYHFINTGGLQELVEYCDDYYQFASKSFNHNKSNSTSNRDATNYQNQVAQAQQWLTNRASSIFSSYDTFDLSDDEDAYRHPTDDIRLPHRPQGPATPLYDLSGRRVTGKPTPGIYVRDGRKIWIK